MEVYVYMDKLCNLMLIVKFFPFTCALHTTASLKLELRRVLRADNKKLIFTTDIHTYTCNTDVPVRFSFCNVSHPVRAQARIHNSLRTQHDRADRAGADAPARMLG